MKHIQLLLLLSLSSLAVLAQSNGTVYVSSGSVWTITGGSPAGDHPIGTNYSTERVATPGYFVGEGTTKFTGADDAHNINGYLKHIPDAANQAYDFPVGTGAVLRKLSIGGTIPATREVATAWIDGDPGVKTDPTNGNALHSTTSLTTGVGTVSKIGQWDWQNSENSTAGMTVTVTLPDVSGFSLTANLRLVGWNNATAKWINLSTGTAPYATGNTAGSTLTGEIPTGIQIDAIGIGSTATVPDLNPTLGFGPNGGIFYPATQTERDFILTVFEKDLADALISTSPIVVRLVVPSSLVITVPGITTLSTTYQSGTSGTSDIGAPVLLPNANGNWEFRMVGTTVLEMRYIGANGGIAKNTFSRIGLHAKVKANILKSTPVLNASVVSTSAGQLNTNNDIATYIINIE